MLYKSYLFNGKNTILSNTKVKKSKFQPINVTSIPGSEIGKCKHLLDYCLEFQEYFEKAVQLKTHICLTDLIKML